MNENTISKSFRSTQLLYSAMKLLNSYNTDGNDIHLDWDDADKIYFAMQQVRQMLKELKK